MGKTRQTDEKFMTSETGNWNVADNFSKFKIMAPLAKCDVYEDIALYGHEELGEELINMGVDSDELRISALRRLINELIRLAKNTMFAMKRDKTKGDLEEIMKRLYVLRDVFLPRTFTIKSDAGAGIRFHSIEPEIFNLVLEKVGQLKSDINLPLNRNHLIFTDREEFDPIAFKEKIRDRIVNQG